MQSDVISLIAFDFILRIVFARMVDIPLVGNVLGVNFHDPAANASGLGIPGYMRADLEACAHVATSAPQVLNICPVAPVDEVAKKD
jgi:hypothetical protein